MARQAFEGQYRVYVGAPFADVSAPTEAEIGDATDVTEQLTADGVQWNWQNNTVSTDMLAEAMTAQTVGTRGLAVTLNATRDDDEDNFFDEFSHGDQIGVLVAPFAGDETPSSGDGVYCLNGSSTDPQPQQSAANTHQQVQVEIPAEEFDIKATVANGA